MNARYHLANCEHYRAALNVKVLDYTHEEYPAVVIEFWEFDCNPDDFDEDELRDYLADEINAIESVDIEGYIRRA